MFKGKIAAFGLAAAVALVSTSAMAAGDAANGEKLFKSKCAVCHDVAKNKVGPSLGGVVGRKSGSVDGFNYSPAMKGSNLTWDAATLAKYLEKPKDTVPNNKMAFPGLPAAQDRDDVIAYLASAK